MDSETPSTTMLESAFELRPKRPPRPSTSSSCSSSSRSSLSLSSDTEMSSDAAKGNSFESNAFQHPQAASAKAPLGMRFSSRRKSDASGGVLSSLHTPNRSDVATHTTPKSAPQHALQSPAGRVLDLDVDATPVYRQSTHTPVASEPFIAAQQECWDGAISKAIDQADGQLDLS
jgi:hypothetical protein